MRGLVNTSWDAFYVLAGMGRIWSTQVELFPRCLGLGLFNLSWDTFSGTKHMLRCFMCTHCHGGDWRTQVKMNIQFLLSFDWFGQLKLSYIFGPPWQWRGFINTCWDVFFFLTSMVNLTWSTYIEMHFVSSQACVVFVNTSWDTSCVSSLQGRVLVNTFWDAFCVLTVMGGVLSKQVEMHFVSSLSFDGFVQLKLRYIFGPPWHGKGFINTCWEAFFFSLAWNGLGQLMLRCFLCPRWNG